MLNEKLSIRNLKEEDLPQMYQAFKDAFKNYPISIDLTENHFQKKFIDRLKISYSYSVGVFNGADLEAFLFTSISRYEGLQTAYNGGTGVVPESRGQGLTRHMYDYLIPKLKNQEIAQCILEVLVDNSSAIKAYENIGFKLTRDFKCFKLDPAARMTNRENPDVKINRVQSPDWKVFRKFFDYIPCYLDSRWMIEKNLNNVIVIEAGIDGMTKGYAIFQPDNGRINQIAVDRSQREKGIGSMLLREIYKKSESKDLNIINVPKDATSIQHFLTSFGFQKELDQYEMRLVL